MSDDGWKPGEPHSELARYAYGFTDKKPSKAYWIVTAIVWAAFFAILARCVTI